MLISSWDRVEDVGLILKQCCANVSFLKKNVDWTTDQNYYKH